ncbi:hypothetical protein BZG36_02888 [Bifiguratus adelaidae]|uniref:Trafficking protein particle complex subunit n=1 Tax=Bifiguratus adelaidae TaxID=1938954 RepID=A0A261Y255_9FUNG|nr:hypothetical protein BZG36_02888 [Bifiguratus adelaidae]
MIYSLYIINKAGGLVYQRDFAEGLTKLTSNEYLILAGTFHGVHAITSRISPVPSSNGLERLDSDQFTLYCFQTLTGTKFLLLTEPSHPNASTTLHHMYEIYSDFVMKNPFHTPEMPIRSDMFDRQLQKYVASL